MIYICYLNIRNRKEEKKTEKDNMSLLIDKREI